MPDRSVMEPKLAQGNLSSSEIEKLLRTAAGQLGFAGGPLTVLKNSIRWADWALSKVPAICLAATYLCLVHKNFSPATLENLFLFCYIFAVANAALGYLLNDFADRDIDLAQGKKNAFHALGMPQGLALMALSAGAMLWASVPFVLQPGFVPLWLLSLALSIAYSLKPLRLKERGAIGVMAAAVAMCGLPIVLMSVSLGFGCDWQALLLAFLCTINGATIEIGHQRFDRAGDKSTGTATLAARMENHQLNRLYSNMLSIDRAAIAAMIVLVLCACINSSPIAAGIAASIALLYVLAGMRTISRIRRGDCIDPHFGSRLLEDRLLHNVIPNFLLPACTIIALCALAKTWILLLVLFVAWRLALYL